jgi:hypothetical protein
MANELNCWTAFKTACTGSATLAAYVKLFRWFRTAFIFQPAQHPVFMAWPENIPEDNYISFPKRKQVVLQVIITGIVMQTGDALENELLNYDALIKNAAETDITLGGKAIITNMGETIFRGLSEGVALLQLPVKITLPHLTAGSR